MFVFDRAGRFLLLMLALSVVPYAFTWHIDGGGEWRFTMLVYPIYLIAAALAVERLAACRLSRPMVGCCARILVKSLGYTPGVRCPAIAARTQAPSREGR